MKTYPKLASQIGIILAMTNDGGDDVNVNGWS
jgi:hypothetical protein